MAQSPVLREPGSRVLLMGNEAIARGAVEAGVQLVASYPGTPSSEVTETLISTAPDCGYYIEWSMNEKVAFEVAAGAAMVGARSLTAMKNAGLNVAMDTYVTLPYGGVKGGFVIVVADDPDAHYSSTEQDTRIIAQYAEIPCLEPMDQQEAKDMTRDAFELSESLELPVFLRTVTRISHASGDVRLGPVTEKRNVLGFNKHWKLPYRWDVYGAPGAVHKHRWLKEQMPKMQAAADACRYNRLAKVKALRQPTRQRR
jgi:indolepyruvate ferredoxin oxidoreductase, alpha subunit